MITIGSRVRSKKLLKPSTVIGIVTGIVTDEVLMTLSRKMSYDQTIYMSRAIDKWIEAYPEANDQACFVDFEEPVTNRNGTKMDSFIVPLVDLEELPDGPCVVTDETVIPLSEEEYLDLGDALLDVKPSDPNGKEKFDAQLQIILDKRVKA